MSVDHQDDGEESFEGRSSVAAGGAEASRACCRTDTEGRCSAEIARGQRRGTRLGFGTEGEREGVDLRAIAAEQDVHVEVQHLEKQEAAANEIESHKNAHSAAPREIEETEVSWIGQMRRQMLEHSARDLHETRWRIQSRIDQPRTPASATGIVRKMP